MIKLAHLGDIHIRCLAQHDVYSDVFGQLYKALKEERPDYIFVCGDIAHTKTDISPEFVELTSTFFLKLANIAKTIIILGNHDCNLKSLQRQDALTPIIKALNHSNLMLVKHSDYIELQEGVSLNVLSILDKQNWRSPKNLDNINIGVYHGLINGSLIDSDFALSGGEADDILRGHDYMLLGDIHKQQQVSKQSYEEKEVSEEELESYLNKGWQLIE